MLHHPRLSCANLWAATAALYRDSRAARLRDVKSPSQLAGVGTGSRIQPAGIYEPRAWASGHVVVPKEGGEQGLRCSEILVISFLLGWLHASLSRAHSRFASGCGPNRLAAQGWSPRSVRVCVHTVDAHSMPIYHMADCCRVHLRGSHDSHAARTGLRLPAGSRSRTSHANLVEMRLMERPGFMDQAHAP
jgi:hypothetical protein